LVRTTSQTNAQMVVSSFWFIQRTDVTIDRSSGYLFCHGQNNEAYFMLAAYSSLRISFYQDNRSRIAMESLEKLNEPLSTVLRNGEPIELLLQQL
jgi:magnesium-transporting ATPase (P-type)